VVGRRLRGCWILPAVNINFIGPWRILLGTKIVRADVGTIEEARDYVETNYGPVLEKKRKSTGVGKRASIWDQSNILLNGTNIKKFEEIFLKDGDRLDLLPKLAGG
jgi:molybdopterin converting factor small subunit